MGIRGPLPKPASVRQRRARLRLVALEPAAGRQDAPRPPAGLLASTRRLWRDYWRSPVAALVDCDADGHLLERWIRSVDEWQRVGLVFRAARLTTGSTGQPVLSPLASYLAQLEAAIGRAEAELGRTPRARARLGITYARAQLTARDVSAALDAAPPWREGMEDDAAPDPRRLLEER